MGKSERLVDHLLTLDPPSRIFRFCCNSCHGRGAAAARPHAVPGVRLSRPLSWLGRGMRGRRAEGDLAATSAGAALGVISPRGPSLVGGPQGHPRHRPRRGAARGTVSGDRAAGVVRLAREHPAREHPARGGSAEEERASSAERVRRGGRRPGVRLRSPEGEASGAGLTAGVQMHFG